MHGHGPVDDTGQCELAPPRALVGRLDAWGLQAARKPEGAESVGLGDVSCPHGSRVCVVVGSSIPSQGQSSVMAARRIGLGSWSIFPLITLPGSCLSSLDCPVVRFCQATGNWGSGLIASASTERAGRSGDIDERAPEPGPGQHLLSSRFFCMAVGNTFNFQSGTAATLATKWTPRAGLPEPRHSAISTRSRPPVSASLTTARRLAPPPEEFLVRSTALDDQGKRRGPATSKSIARRASVSSRPPLSVQSGTAASR